MGKFERKVTAKNCCHMSPSQSHRVGHTVLAEKSLFEDFLCTFFSYSNRMMKYLE
jgi:hypothetical protein